MIPNRTRSTPLICRALLALSAAALTSLCAQDSPSATPPPATGHLHQLGSRGVRLHDPSTIVRENGTFWLFHTGRGIPSYRSTDLLHWTTGPRVFTNTLAWVKEAVPENRNGMDFWAPDIIQLRDRYYVYYSVSSFGKNTSAIALAANATLDPAHPDYAWTDEGIVLQSHRTNNFNAIDPALTLDHQDRLWMAFGSFWDGIKMVELNPDTGKRLAPDSTIFSLARHPEIEAPHIFRHNDHYYLFVNWGRCCRGTNSTYNIRVGRSSDITGPYLDRDGKSMADGGGTLLLDTAGDFIGPGHPSILAHDGRFWMSLHFYDATQRGRSTLAIRQLLWDQDGWPTILEGPAAGD